MLLLERYAGAFYNPFFHRDINEEADFSRITRRPPPSERASKKIRTRPGWPEKRKTKKRKVNPEKETVNAATNVRSTRRRSKIKKISLRCKASSSVQKVATCGLSKDTADNASASPTEAEALRRNGLGSHTQGFGQGPHQQTIKEPVSVNKNWGKKQLLAARKPYDTVAGSNPDSCRERETGDGYSHHCPTPPKRLKVSTPSARVSNGDAPNAIREPVTRTPQLGFGQVPFTPSQMAGTNDNTFTFGENDLFSSSPLIPFNSNLLLDSPHPTLCLADSIFLPIEAQQPVTAGSEKARSTANVVCATKSDAKKVEGFDQAKQSRAIRIRFHQGNAKFSPLDPSPRTRSQQEKNGSCNTAPLRCTTAQPNTPQSRNPRSVLSTPLGSTEDKTMSVQTKSEFGYAKDLSHTLYMQGESGR